MASTKRLEIPRCTLICVGSELLRGKINTHSSTIARRLASIGLALHADQTIGDDLPQLTKAIRRALFEFEIVMVTGGLGPTFDDLTREAAAEAVEKRLILSPSLARGIAQKFRRAHYKMPPENERQAYLIEGAQPVSNPVGTAPGQWLVDGKTILILLPGPPRELHPMLERYVIPALKKAFPVMPTAEAHLHFVGVPESVVDHKIRPIIAKVQQRRAPGTEGARRPSVDFTILAYLGLVDLDIFVRHPSSAQARRIAGKITESVRRLFKNEFYGMEDSYPLQKAVGDRLRRMKATVAVAESCTGGMLASRLTDTPGSSDYFLGGIISYSNAAKIRFLGVPQFLIEKHGAVSRLVALAMAHGIRQEAGSTIGVGITGIAGPEGGTASKPIGLVHIAVVSDQSAIDREYHFFGDRDAIRQRAILAALDLLRQCYPELQKTL